MYLVKGREDVVGELNLGNGFHAFCCCTDCEADEALLTEWCVEDTFGTKVGREVHGASKDSAKLYVLAKDHDALVFLEGMTEGFVDGCVEVDALGLAFLYLLGELWICEGRFCSVMEEGGCGVVYGSI